MKNNKPSQEELFDLYINQQFSQRDLAKMYNVGQTTIRRWMIEYDIKARSLDKTKKTNTYLNKIIKASERYKTEYLKPHKLTCYYCENTFIVYGSDKKNQKYCSDECRHNALSKPLEAQYCVNCGKIIENKNNRRYKRKYCAECTELHVWIQPDRVKTECAYCNKQLFVTKSRFENNEHCFCDTECMANYYSMHYTGENSPTWKGGKPDHYIGRFNKQRDLARERDNYTCQLCGITEDEYNKQMSVHHINLYRNYDDKMEANKLENLVCLCESCHRFVHSNANIEKIFLQENNSEEDIV